MREEEAREDFFPSGAVAFFLILVGFYAGLWLLIYWLFVERG
jgi:hypothetical protein